MKRGMARRGQAALEFLSTYGFAFLIIMVMIGALSYFGILSPDKLIPSRCSISPEFSCDETRIYDPVGTDVMRLEILLTNEIGDQLRMNTTTYVTTQYGVTNCSVVPNPLLGASSGLITCSWGAGVTFPTAGKKVKAIYDGNYTPAGKRFSQFMHIEVLQSIS